MTRIPFMRLSASLYDTDAQNGLKALATLVLMPIIDPARHILYFGYGPHEFLLENNYYHCTLYKHLCQRGTFPLPSEYSPLWGDPLIEMCKVFFKETLMINFNSINLSSSDEIQYQHGDHFALDRDSWRLEMRYKNKGLMPLKRLAVVVRFLFKEYGINMDRYKLEFVK